MPERPSHVLRSAADSIGDSVDLSESGVFPTEGAGSLLAEEVRSPTEPPVSQTLGWDLAFGKQATPFATGLFLPQAPPAFDPRSLVSELPQPALSLAPYLASHPPIPFESWMGGPATQAQAHGDFGQNVHTRGSTSASTPSPSSPDTSFPWPWVPQEETPIWEKHWPLLGWDRYENRGFLASGGMGRVFKAWDPRLQRLVAIKFLKGDDPDLTQRFIQEARIQAKVEHENVCKVFEVGQERGHAFIVMPFIQGEHLGKASREMNRTQLAATLRKVAEGVHEAHRQGLIHRDLKPANIMAERQEDGHWQPFVMDFGLARETTAQGQTQIGTILGTPSYMAPEQARGDVHQLDRRTDVYSLGATLYALLVGHPPFQSESAYEVIRQVIEEDPKPLHDQDPSIPPDLEAIALKAMEKEPGRRYESARALAEDLGRYLEGEPVEARAVDWSYKLKLKLRKNRNSAIVVGVGLLLTLVLSGLWARSAWVASRQFHAATRLGQDVKELEALMRYAHLMPLHDTRWARQEVEQRLARFEGELGHGSAVEGPARYALGQGYLALEKPESARDQLEKAWKSGYRNPDVAQALGLALGRLFQGELEKLRNFSPESRQKAEADVNRRFRDPALQFLSESGSPSSFTQALIAFYQKDFSKARLLAERAKAERPWFYEAQRLEGDVLMELGNVQRFSGDLLGAAGSYQAAEALYQSAARLGESDPSVHQALCSLWKWVLYLKVYDQGQDPAAAGKAMECACNRASVADPDRPLPWTEMSESFRLMAEYAQQHGQDATPWLDRSSQAAERALNLEPGCAEAHHHLGNANGLKGLFSQGPFQTQLDFSLQSIRNMERAAQLAPQDTRIALDLGNAYFFNASLNHSHGLDPEPMLQKAIQANQRSIELSPSYTYPYNNLGDAQRDLACWRKAKGQDGSRALEEACMAYRKALEINPKYVDAWNGLAQALLFMAEQNNAQRLDEAEQAARKALELRSDYYLNYEVLGRILILKAGTGNKQSPYFLEGMNHLQSAFRINPKAESVKLALAQAGQKRALSQSKE